MSTVTPAGKELVDFANKNPHIRVPYAVLGWVANPKTHRTGYHCGWDIIGNNQGWGDYSLRLQRDANGIKMDWNAASGFDIGTDWALHDQWLKFLTDAFLAGAGWTSDIREIIGSFDGVNWYGWITRADGSRYRTAANSYSDSSHRWHTHIGFFRDALRRSKLFIFTYFLNWKFPAAPVTGRYSVAFEDDVRNVLGKILDGQSAQLSMSDAPGRGGHYDMRPNHQAAAIRDLLDRPAEVRFTDAQVGFLSDRITQAVLQAIQNANPADPENLKTLVAETLRAVSFKADL